uniref:Uncharacterized protein n=1 Tax=Amphimedon queenslandica TaxID=400682 RepID=A0A1X7TZ55_AMPQE
MSSIKVTEKREQQEKEESDEEAEGKAGIEDPLSGQLENEAMWSALRSLGVTLSVCCCCSCNKNGLRSQVLVIAHKWDRSAGTVFHVFTGGARTYLSPRVPHPTGASGTMGLAASWGQYPRNNSSGPFSRLASRCPYHSPLALALAYRPIPGKAVEKISKGPFIEFKELLVDKVAQVSQLRELGVGVYLLLVLVPT